MIRSSRLDRFVSQMEAEIGSGILKLDEPLSRHTTMGVGGPADAFAAPESTENMRAIVAAAVELDLPVKTIGAGSNLLVSDEGYRGLVITSRFAFRSFRADGERVVAGSGVTLGQLIQQCRKHGLSGLEALTGIPGTLGGALYMNASAYGTEISEFVQSVHVLSTTDLSAGNVTAGSLAFGYRSSAFVEESLIESAELILRKDNPAAISDRVEDYLERRRSTQPIWDKSAGCIFKNPEGRSAGRMIDEAGLKGTSVGRAMVSDIHGNFIINNGGATFSDVRNLIDIVQERVRDVFDTELALEVEILQ
jgi:UDP-N-acetylmuramate dehydrogenase